MLSCLFFGACQTSDAIYQFSDQFHDRTENSNILFDVVSSHDVKCQFVNLKAKNQGTGSIIKIKNIKTNPASKIRILEPHLLAPGNYQIVSISCANSLNIGKFEKENLLIGAQYWISDLTISNSKYVYPGTIIISKNSLSSMEKEKILNMTGVDPSSNQRLPLEILPLFEEFKTEDRTRLILTALENSGVSLSEVDLMENSGFSYNNLKQVVLSQSADVDLKE